MARGTIEGNIVSRVQDGEAAGDSLIVIQLFELSNPKELPGQPRNDSTPCVAHPSFQSSLENMAIQPDGRHCHFTKHHLRGQLIIRTGPPGYSRPFPVAFKISYDERDIYPSLPYELNVRIEDRGTSHKVRWLSKIRPRVLTFGAPKDNVEVFVDKV
ncbi:hypothetical protein BGZ82_003486 [Podila clonocystis]|nr:hypothetical protein BGZ82_003486 [Podila clonocystis]